TVTSPTMVLVTLLSVLVAPSLTTCARSAGTFGVSSTTPAVKNPNSLRSMVSLAERHRTENPYRQDWRFTANEPEMVETRKFLPEDGTKHHQITLLPTNLDA